MHLISQGLQVMTQKLINNKNNWLLKENESMRVTLSKLKGFKFAQFFFIIIEIRHIKILLMPFEVMTVEQWSQVLGFQNHLK